MSNYSDEDFDEPSDVSPILTTGSPSPMHPISGYSATTKEKGERQHVIDENEDSPDVIPLDSDEKLYLREKSENKSELVEFNKELQWTLMEMKKENDIMRYNLQFAMNGGDLQKMQGKEKLKAFLDMTPDVPDAFQTPDIANDFERDSDFQIASAAVKSFGEESIELRKPVKMIIEKQKLSSEQIKALPTPIKSEVMSSVQRSSIKATPVKSSIMDSPAKSFIQATSSKEMVTPEKSPLDLGIARTMITEKLSQRSSARKQQIETEEQFDKNASARSMLKEKLESMSSSRVGRTEFPETFEAGEQVFEPTPLKNLEERARKQLNLAQFTDEKYRPRMRLGAPAHYTAMKQSQDMSDPTVYADYMQSCLESRATNSFVSSKDLPPKDVPSVHQLVKDFSRQTTDGEKLSWSTAGYLRKMASDPWAQCNREVKRMKHPDIERYVAYTVKLGLQDESNVDINMSPEGKMRRQKIKKAEVKYSDHKAFSQAVI